MTKRKKETKIRTLEGMKMLLQYNQLWTKNQRKQHKEIQQNHL
jgi:hypothetical protein